MLILAGMVFGLVGWVPYSALDILVSTVFLVAVSLITNAIFAKIFGAAPASDSVYVTALILALIITPTDPFSQLPFLAWAAFLANASKYLLAWRRRHIFNPAALAVVITSLFLGQSASWWVGCVPMLPLVLLGGVLVIRQIRRFDLVWAFFMADSGHTAGFRHLRRDRPDAGRQAGGAVLADVLLRLRHAHRAADRAAHPRRCRCGTERWWACCSSRWSTSGASTVHRR